MIWLCSLFCTNLELLLESSEALGLELIFFRFEKRGGVRGLELFDGFSAENFFFDKGR